MKSRVKEISDRIYDIVIKFGEESGPNTKCLYFGEKFYPWYHDMVVFGVEIIVGDKYKEVFLVPELSYTVDALNVEDVERIFSIITNILESKV